MIKIAILTPLSLEKDAVLKHLDKVERESKEGDLYHKGYFVGQHHKFEVIVKKTGAGNETVSLAAERLISRFSPQVLFLTGIAGGVKDVQIGDVVIGTQAHGYDIGKETEGGFKARPESYPAHKSLINLAELVADSDSWRARNPTEKKSKIFFGPIASGNKVIASINQSTYTIIKNHYNNTVALEMEAFGVGKALHNHSSVHWINVRSISDLLAGKKEEEDVDNQPFAAAQAAAFLFEMLYQMNATQMNLHEIHQRVTSEIEKSKENNTELIHNLIKKSKIKEAVEEILKLTKAVNEDVYQQALLQSKRLSKVTKEERLGLISHDDAEIAQSRIVYGLLEMVKEL